MDKERTSGPSETVNGVAFATMPAWFANLPITLFPGPEMDLELILSRLVCCGKLSLRRSVWHDEC